MSGRVYFVPSQGGKAVGLVHSAKESIAKSSDTATDTENINKQPQSQLELPQEEQEENSHPSSSQSISHVVLLIAKVPPTADQASSSADLYIPVADLISVCKSMQATQPNATGFTYTSLDASHMDMVKTTMSRLVNID
jgi:hypothetical protein